MADPATPQADPARPGLHPIRLWHGVVDLVADDGLVMAGHLTFIALISLFPFLIFLMALAGFLGQTEAGTEAVAFMLANMPPEIAAVLQQPILDVLQETRGGLLTIGILAAIWTASSGLEAARIGLNRAYYTGYRPPVWRSRLESIGLVILTSGVIIVAMLLLVLGPVAWQAATALMHLPAGWERGWHAIRYGLGTGILFLVVAGLYTVLPAARLKPRWVVPGALLTVLLWIVVATGFSIYLAHFGAYNVTYGSLGGVVVALIFFYALAAIFLYGAEVNAAIARAEGGLPPRARRFSRDRSELRR
jgi:membrane protein